MKMFNPIARRDAGTWSAIVAAVPNRRANAIYPLGPVPDRLDTLISLYPLHGRPVRCKVPDWASPTTRKALRSLRFRPVYGAHVMAAPIREVEDAGALQPGVITESIDDDWLAVNRGFPATGRSSYGAAATSTVAVRIAGASVGLAVLEGGWAGIAAMYTQPHHRREGLAKRVLSLLLSEARSRGAERAFLQVVESNQPAMRLYDGYGFEVVTSYDYWE